MTDSSAQAGTPPFACDMTALTPDERAAHRERLALLFGWLVRERRELSDGFAYRFDGEHLLALATFVATERRCCPFLAFELEVAPASGPLWLRITAPGEVKPFLLAEFRTDQTSA